MLSSKTKKIIEVRKITVPLIVFCLLFIIFGCTSSSNDAQVSSPKEITAFSLDGVDGTIDGKNIAVTVPHGTVVTDLAATFETTGDSVSVGSTVQESGVTPNDFSSPVDYTVTGHDGSKKDYTVTVTIAPSSDKAITEFSLAGVAGTFNGNNIAVTVPHDTVVTALAATFTTTGASVKVGEAVQVSGQTPNDFTNPVTYTVTASDASTQNYIVTVTLGLANQPATAITVSMAPHNPTTGTNPPPPGVYCTKSLSIIGSFNVTDIDGGSTIVTYWYDNDVLTQTHTITLAGGENSGTDIYYNYGGGGSEPHFFQTHHTIKFKASADGVMSNTDGHQIT